MPPTTFYGNQKQALKPGALFFIATNCIIPPLQGTAKSRRLASRSGSCKTEASKKSLVVARALMDGGCQANHHSLSGFFHGFSKPILNKNWLSSCFF